MLYQNEIPAPIVVPNIIANIRSSLVMKHPRNISRNAFNKDRYGKSVNKVGMRVAQFEQGIFD